jgi:hypothetical protein
VWTCESFKSHDFYKTRVVLLGHTLFYKRSSIKVVHSNLMILYFSTHTKNTRAKKKKEGGEGFEFRNPEVVVDFLDLWIEDPVFWYTKAMV